MRLGVEIDPKRESGSTSNRPKIEKDTESSTFKNFEILLISNFKNLKIVHSDHLESHVRSKLIRLRPSPSDFSKF